jgi:hypothetical protein
MHDVGVFSKDDYARLFKTNSQPVCTPIGKPTQLAFEYADEDAEDTGKGL